MDPDDLNDIEARATYVSDERARADIRALVAELRDAWVRMESAAEELQNGDIGEALAHLVPGRWRE